MSNTIACVVIPHFAAAVHRQVDPALSDVPLLLVKHGTKRSKIAAISSEAEKLGASPGLALGRARGLCPDGHFVALDETRLQSAIDGLFKSLWEFTNRVELDITHQPQTGVFYLDLGRLTDGDARAIGEQMRVTVEGQFGSSRRGHNTAVGLARGKFPAYAAAMCGTGETTFVSRQEEAAFIAPFPSSLLPMSKETARRLQLLCIREIGHVAVLPREELIAQFGGKEGKLLYQFANGLDGRTVKPRQMPKTENVVHQFEYPVTDRIRLDVVVHQLAGTLAERLEARGTALHALTLTLHFESSKARVEHLHLLQPVVSAAAIAKTIQQLLQREKIARGVIGLEVCLTHLVPNIPRQLELLTHKPGRTQLIDLAQVLTARHGACFYEAELHEFPSLVPEQRFKLLRLDAS